MPPFFVFWILLNNLLSIACLPAYLTFLPIFFAYWFHKYGPGSPY